MAIDQATFHKSRLRKPTNQQLVRNAVLAGSTGQLLADEQGIRAYLGSHELGSTTESTGSLAIPHILLTQTIIGNLHMTIKRQENIIELQISINNALGVEILQRKQDFTGIELGLSKGELLLLDVKHEISS
jgi:hypothetical protein